VREVDRLHTSNSHSYVFIMTTQSFGHVTNTQDLQVFIFPSDK